MPKPSKSEDSSDEDHVVHTRGIKRSPIGDPIEAKRAKLTASTEESTLVDADILSMVDSEWKPVPFSGLTLKEKLAQMALAKTEFERSVMKEKEEEEDEEEEVEDPRSQGWVAVFSEVTPSQFAEVMHANTFKEENTLWIITLGEGQPHSEARHAARNSLVSYFGPMTTNLQDVNVCGFDQGLGANEPNVILKVRSPNLPQSQSVLIMEIGNTQSYHSLHRKALTYFDPGSPIQYCIVIKLDMDAIVPGVPRTFAAIAVLYSSNDVVSGATPVDACFFGTYKGNPPDSRLVPPHIIRNANGFVPPVGPGTHTIPVDTTRLFVGTNYYVTGGEGVPPSLTNINNLPQAPYALDLFPIHQELMNCIDE